MANSHSGVVSQVMGPVVDVRFDGRGTSVDKQCS